MAAAISAGMTAFAGVIYAFYYNNLFPEQVFNISQSILIVLAPFVGGLGTLFGPILGAFVLETIAESMRVLLEWLGVDLPGTNQLLFGVVLLTVVIALPDGVWPWICRQMGLTEQKP
jgi:branched-chain amino acid transport system permease protein